MPTDDSAANDLPPQQDLIKELDDLWGAPGSLESGNGEEQRLVGIQNAIALDYDIDWNPPWFIGPCIRPGDVAYFVGPDGAGKSTLLAELLCHTLAPIWSLSGAAKFETPTLSGAWRVNKDWITEDAMVLIINAETDGSDAWNRRLQATLIAQGHTPASRAYTDIRRRIRYMECDDLGLATLNPEKRRAAAIHTAHAIVEAGYKIVVLDPVFGVFGAEDNADANWVTFGLRPLCRTLKENGVTTLCAAHPSKVGDVKGVSLRQRFSPFGSSQQEGIMDVRLGIKLNVSDPNRVEIYRIKSRRAAWITTTGVRNALILTKGNPASYVSAINSEAWTVDNPVVMPLPPDVIEIFGCIPDSRDDFMLDDVMEAWPHKKELDKRKWATARDEYLIPFKLMTQRRVARPGRPWVYNLTEAGLNERRKIGG